MTLAFGSAIGNIFNRLGSLAQWVKQLQAYQAAQKTNMIDGVVGAVAQLDGEPDIQAIIGDNYISSLNSPDNIGSLAQQVAEAIVNRMIFRDNPQINQNLTSFNTLTSINEVIRQMKQEQATILAMTITGTPTAFTGTGNGVVVFSNKRPLDGLVLENSFGETVLFTCTADSYLGGATPFNETINITGAGSESDLFAFDWPLGSNGQASVSAVDGDTSNGSNNLLTNSNFNSWQSTTVPNNYIIDTNSRNITQDTGIVYTGTSSLKLTGDGSTKVQFRQQFNSASGTSSVLTPLTQYSFNIFLRRDGVAANTGILTIDLEDGLGNILQDANGVNNSFTIDLTQLTTQFAAYNVAFRTPLIMPPALYLRYQNSTPLPNGRGVYLAKASLGQMTQLYTSGPFFNVHSGSIPYVFGDYAKCLVTNSRGAGGTLSTWQTALAQLFANYAFSNEILWPSSATPTVSDQLI